MILNQLMLDAMCAHDVALSTAADPSSFVWVTAADAVWPNWFDGTSTRGHLIMAAHPSVEGRGRPCVCVELGSRAKSRRVVQSSLGVECAHLFSTGFEHADLSRVLWTENCGGLVGLDQYGTYLQGTDAICVNDCKSFADALLSAVEAASQA